VEGDKYYGAKATINVWKPQIQQPNEFSLSQIWILGGSFGQDLNSIEAGWQVYLLFSSSLHLFPYIYFAQHASRNRYIYKNDFLFFPYYSLRKQVSPDLYGDNNTRLFTYWTVSFGLIF
jgi:hypothetical protein